MAVRTRNKKAAPKHKAPKPLNAQQETFCYYYSQNSETFGNAVLSYAAAYDYKLDDLSRVPKYKEVFGQIDDDGEPEENRVIEEPSPYDKAYSVCGTEGSKLLKKPEVQERCRQLLNDYLRDNVVDGELSRTIQQDRDLPSKIAAIREYNKLRGRIIDKTKIIADKFAVDDIRSLLSVLPQERQDEVYATLTSALAEAELLRGGEKATSGGTK